MTGEIDTTMNANRRQSIVILGGGFGGVYTAMVAKKGSGVFY